LDDAKHVIVNVKSFQEVGKWEEPQQLQAQG